MEPFKYSRLHVCLSLRWKSHSNASAYKLFLTFRFFLQHITRHIKFKTEQNFFHWRILSFTKSRVKETDEKKWNVVNVAPSKVIRILGNFFLWNLQFWALESGFQLWESWIPQRLKSGIQYIKSGIQGVESGIRDCLGLPYKGAWMRQYVSFTINILAWSSGIEGTTSGCYQSI